MELISLQFVLHVIFSLVAYYGVGRFLPKHQWKVLLLSSIIFYLLAAGVPSLIFLLTVSFLTWWGGVCMGDLSAEAKEARKAISDRTERKTIRELYRTKRRRVMIAVLVASFAILAWLKYYNTVLYDFGLEPSPTSLGILLPLGISFFTFQSVGYVVDVYNERFEPQRDFARHLLFVSWFPQIVQGPINRYAEMGPQLVEERSADERGIVRGLLLMGYGMLKKVCVASVLAPTVAAALAHIGPDIPGVVVAFGILTYSFQMYADFSGGIDIVRGVSEMFGVEMAHNFEQPYFSRSLSEFWQRWHMSLGEWMKNYVFYPLALTKPMQRLGKAAQKSMGRHIGRVLPACIANILVFLLVGLWHGAEWHYLAWGLYNGVVIAATDLLSPVFEKLRQVTRYDDSILPVRIFAMLRTFTIVCIGRYFDIIPDVGQSLRALANTFTNFAPIPIRDALAAYGIPGAEHFGISGRVVAILLVVLVVSILKERGVDVRERICDAPFALRLVIYLALWITVAYSFIFLTDGGGRFLYANF